MKLSFSLFTCLFVQFVIAQKIDTAIYLVRYTFTHVKDTLAPEVIYRENMILGVSSKSSFYDSEDRVIQDSILEHNTITTVDENGRTVTRGGGYKKKPLTITTIYRFNDLKKSYLVQHYLSHEYIMEVEMPIVKWNLENERKVINGVECQKATGYCKGRLYEVWFAPSIPYAFGPWKLNGLPGLILEAQDSKKQICFLFAGMQETGKSKPLIKLPSNGRNTTINEFKLMFEETQNNPSAAIKIALDGNSEFKPTNPIIFSKPSSNRRVINNPIELSNE